MTFWHLIFRSFSADSNLNPSDNSVKLLLCEPPKEQAMNIQIELEQAINYCHSGHMQEAEKICNSILSVYPDQSRCLHILGIIAHADRDYEKSEYFIKRAILIDPEEPVYYKSLGKVLMDQGELKNAVLSYHKTVELKPDCAEAYFYLGSIYNELNEPDTSIAFYEKVLQIDPGFYEACYNMGNIYYSRDDPEKAIQCYQRAIDIKPDFYEALHNLGVSYQYLENADLAIAAFKKTLQIKPDYAEAYYNMGNALHAKGLDHEAIFSYQQAIGIKTDYVAAYHNLGKIFYGLGMQNQSMSCYKKAVKLKPDHTDVLYDMGLLYWDQYQLDNMIACYEKALMIKPDLPHPYLNLAIAYKLRGDIDKAVSCCRKALRIQPDFAEAKAYLVQLYQHACEWKKIEKLSVILDKLNEKALKNGLKAPECPMLSLRRHDDPCINYAVAKSWCCDISKCAEKQKTVFLSGNERLQRSKLTIGYLSSDFKNHAVTHLSLGLYGLHNRDEFKILCYSCGKDDGSYYRERIREKCDEFIDLTGLSNLDAAKRINKDKVDILVDMMGHTKGNRLGISALRPAPVQVGYLGFLGTTGADFIDYIITDKIVTPANHSPYYSESFAYLPHCYQINDCNLKIAGNNFKKTDLGLPDNSFVFCSFNQPYKIDSLIFTGWMNILRQVPNGILWLLRQNKTAENNLRRGAEARGISPERLVFAGALSIEEHLARVKVADLALDTRTYNGGATTSNALWAGVPVITLKGNHFVSRMSSSSLTAIGLPELITTNLEEYESLAVSLARNQDKLNAIRRKLAENRLTEPLFDTPRFVKNLETAFKKMWNIFAAGQRPRIIEVVETAS